MSGSSCLARWHNVRIGTCREQFLGEERVVRGPGHHLVHHRGRRRDPRDPLQLGGDLVAIQRVQHEPLGCGARVSSLTDSATGRAGSSSSARTVTSSSTGSRRSTRTR
jgi:hypothetical protein